MMKITLVENPPLRLQVGHDCIVAVEAKFDRVRRELDQWRVPGESTDLTA